MSGECGAYGGGEGCTDCGGGNLRERGHWGDPDVDGRITLRRIFRKLERVVGTGVGSGEGRVAGTCEYSKELSSSIKMRGIS
jgi:hypothetical protein